MSQYRPTDFGETPMRRSPRERYPYFPGDADPFIRPLEAFVPHGAPLAAPIPFRPDEWPHDPAYYFWLLSNGSSEAGNVGPLLGAARPRDMQGASDPDVLQEIIPLPRDKPFWLRDPEPGAPIGAEPPAYRAQVPAVRDSWPYIRRDAAPYSPAKQNTYSRLFAAEGGLEPNVDSNAIGGMLPDTLRDLQRRSPDIGTGSISSLFRTYDQYFDDVLGSTAKSIGGVQRPSDLLDRLPDRDTAAAVADTLFRDGRAEGARLLQSALNATVDELSREDPELEQLRRDADGRMGPQTYAAIDRLSRLGYGAQLRAHLAELRTGKHRKESARFDSFR
jgi:hypothetical protein